MNHKRDWRRAVRLPGLCAVLLAGGLVTVEAAPVPAGVQLPPLSQPASGEHHVGKVIWVDLVTPDLERAKQFYSGLFGWSFQTVAGDPNYAVALLDGEPVGGLLQKSIPSGQHRQPAWLTFIAVGDVDAAKRAALAHGAKVLSEPKTYAQRGRQAVFADPDGAVFAVLASSSGDPPDALAAPGEWIWSSLLVKDPDHEAAFYHALFGYDVFDVPTDDSSKHVILSSDDYARAGLTKLPGDTLRRHPHWLSFVRVADADAASAKAVQLGGRVLVEPRIDMHGGKLAVVADPSGAPVGLMEWSETDSPQEPQ
jgi:predicted enzyme related to lactoylglutathione lyase